jgi:hypothetical protein
MKLEDRKLRSVLVSTFTRKGGPDGSTFVCDAGQLGAIWRAVVLAPEESPVILSTSEDHPWLLTTRRLLIGKSDRFSVVKLTEIAGVEPKEFSKTPKSEMTKLRIESSDGHSQILEIDRGDPFIGMWSVLMFLAVRNKNVGSV